MDEQYTTFLSLEGALNSKFRGHIDRDWQIWREKHAYSAAADILVDADRAWLGRQGPNFRGIGHRQALRHLIASNVDQPFLDEIGCLVRLERLELEWPMVAKDLAPLLRLDNLQFLSIDSPRHISDFSPLLQLPKLRTLIITNPKKMASLDWLSDAQDLEVIGIEGGMWSPYKISTLKPLAGLRKLRAFLGVSTKLVDKQLFPLQECPSLEFLSVASFAPQEEFEQLRRHKPDLICSWFRQEMWNAIATGRRGRG